MAKNGNTGVLARKNVVVLRAEYFGGISAIPYSTVDHIVTLTERQARSSTPSVLSSLLKCPLQRKKVRIREHIFHSMRVAVLTPILTLSVSHVTLRTARPCGLAYFTCTRTSCLLASSAVRRRCSSCLSTCATSSIRHLNQGTISCRLGWGVSFDRLSMAAIRQKVKDVGM